MLLWSYTPQRVLVEQRTLPVDRAITAGAVFAGVSRAAQRTFRLQYDLVTSADCAGMRAFYAAVSGAWLAFDWVSPLDDMQYRVRFDGAQRLEHVTPVYFASGGEIVLVEVPT